MEDLASHLLSHRRSTACKGTSYHLQVRAPMGHLQAKGPMPVVLHNTRHRAIHKATVQVTATRQAALQQSSHHRCPQVLA
jgi:hypothetical protein